MRDAGSDAAAPAAEHAGRDGSRQSSDPSRLPSDADVALLWAAAGRPPDLERLAVASREADIPFVLETAARHRVSPLVLRALGEAGVEVDPADPAVDQAKLWEAHARLALPLAAAMALEPLNGAGLGPVVLKGLAVSGRYAGPGLRPMDDIDVLLPKPLWPQAVAILEGAGWVRARHPHRDPGYDAVFVHPSIPGVPLELHHQLARWGERPRSLDAETIWAARIPIDVLGHPAWGLPPELEVLALVVHAAKPFHVFSRLSWLVDLCVITGSPTFDWGRLQELTRAARRRVAVGVALALAKRLGADVPPALLDIPLEGTRSAAFEVLLDPARPFRAQFSPRWQAYVLVDDVRDAIRLALNDLIKPTGRTPRPQIARELAGMALRGIPRLVRTRVRGR